MSFFEIAAEVREVGLMIIGTFIVAFTIGMVFGGYLGVPDRVDTLEQDMAAVVCMVVAQQEQRSGMNCYLLMSEDTRQFIERLQWQSGPETVLYENGIIDSLSNSDH